MWRFVVTREAEEDVAGLDTDARRRIFEKLKWFQEHFDEVTPFPLNAEWHGFFKLRIGDYRIIYTVDDSTYVVTIHLVDRRDRVYKRR